MTPEQAWKILLQVLITKSGLSMDDLVIAAQAKQVIEQMVVEAIKPKEDNNHGNATR